MELVARGDIYQLIDPWKWVAVIWARLLKVGVVNTDAPFPTCLLDEDYIGEPLEVLHFPDEAGF